MITWIVGIWLVLLVLAVALAIAAGRADSHADAVMEQLQLEPEAAAPPPEPAAGWALVVDDDDLVRRGIVHLVTTWGYAAREARTGPEALRLARQHPAFILLDLWLPVIDGFDVADQLRHDPQLRTIPIVALSADASPRVRTWAQERGVVHFIEKPLDPEALRNLLNDLESSHRSAVSLVDSTGQP